MSPPPAARPPTQGVGREMTVITDPDALAAGAAARARRPRRSRGGSTDAGRPRSVRPAVQPRHAVQPVGDHALDQEAGAGLAEQVGDPSFESRHRTVLAVDVRSGRRLPAGRRAHAAARRIDAEAPNDNHRVQRSNTARSGSVRRPSGAGRGIHRVVGRAGRVRLADCRGSCHRRTMTAPPSHVGSAGEAPPVPAAGFASPPRSPG